METPLVPSDGFASLAHQLHRAPNRIVLAEKDTGQGKLHKAQR